MQWSVPWRRDLLSFASAGSKYPAARCTVRVQVTLTSSSGTFLMYCLTEQDLQYIPILSVAVVETMANYPSHLHKASK